VYREYQTVVLPLSDSLPRSVIMGDCNDANIITREGVVSGLIDFSDAVHTWSVNEIAIAMAYALITSFGQLSPYEALGALLLGYTRGRRLSEQELIALPVLIATRLSISISVGAYSISKEPENEYLKLHALPARKSLLLLWSTERKTHVEFFREVQEAGLSNGDFTDGMLVDIIDKHYK
jgi:Ser/Thr protein kinase RdoA (MazF antagonist)